MAQATRIHPPDHQHAPAHDAARASPREPYALDVDTLVPWLLRNDLVSASDIVHGKLAIEDRTRRNRNFVVLKKDGKGLLVKQTKQFDDFGLVSSLRNEGQFLRALAYDDLLEPFAPKGPRLLYYSPQDLILATELIHPATSLTKLHLNLGKVDFSKASAVSSARLLADFHRTGRAALEAGRLPFAKPKLPISLAIFTYLLERSRVGDSMARAFLRRVQDTPVGPANAHLAALVKAWPEGQELVHGDARWDNYLLTHGEAARGDLNLRLIDWELVGRGEAAYDVACFLGEYARFWAVTALYKGVQQPSDVAEKAPFRLEEAGRSAAWFLDAYAKRRGLRGKTRTRVFERAAEHLPHYLVQAAWEMTMNYGVSGKDEEIAPWSHAVLDLAIESRKDPVAWLRERLGVEVVA